jgi:hypothetical protein
MHHYPEELHLAVLGKALDLYELALFKLLFAPIQLIHPLIRLLAPQVWVYGVVAPLLKVIGHVGQGVVDLAAQQILAVVQLRKTHISSVADFLSA